MGVELRSARDRVSSIPWLDATSCDLVRDIVATVAEQHPDLRAALLFGSVARHEERPLDDPEPSDVDLLLLFALERELTRLPYGRMLDVFESVGQARRRHPDAPREVQVLLATRDLEDWDPLFVENLAREGMLLWARGPLPAPLAPIATRSSAAHA